MRKGPRPTAGTTVHIPSLKNADTPPGRAFAFTAAERDRLVNEGTATWSGAPDVGASKGGHRGRWASSYQLEYNEATFPDSFWNETKRQRPEKPVVVVNGTPSPEKQKTPGLRLSLSSALNGGNDERETYVPRPSSARPARPLTARERAGGPSRFFEKDRVKNALGIPEVVPPSGWTGHLPQRKSNNFNVGQTWTTAYGRSGTPVAGYKGFVARGTEVAPGISHNDKMHSARAMEPANGTGTGSKPEGDVGADGSSTLRKSRTMSYSDTPAHLLHKAVVCSRVVDIDTRTDFFANESPTGASRHAVPRLAINSKAGNVQLDKHAPSSVYLGDLTQYWSSENPYKTSAMAASQHVDPRKKDGKDTPPWQHFKPVAGYDGFTPQNGPRSARLLTAQPINKDADKGGDGQSRKGGGGVGGAGRVSWHEADALSPIDPFVSASN